MVNIIAEIAQGYEGSEKLAELYVKGAANAKADIVKFQIFSADELATKDYQYYDLFRSLELPMSAWRALVDKAHGLGLKFYSDIFGLETLEELDRIGVDGFKIHATDLTNGRLLKEVASKNKPVLLAFSGYDVNEIQKALALLGQCPVTLMLGFQSEPTLPADNNLARIITAKKIFGLPIGFQDHTAGDSDLNEAISFLALGLGVTTIEKHMTLSRKAEVEDCVSALNVEEFCSWVDRVRKSEPALGSSTFVPNEKEIEYRGKVQRAVCAACDLLQGKNIDPVHLALKRTSSKHYFTDMDAIVGRPLKRTVKKNHVFSEEDFK